VKLSAGWLISWFWQKIHFMLHPEKKTLQIPDFPLITGSSPLWIQTEATFNPASVLHFPLPPSKRLTWQLHGHVVQSLRAVISVFEYIVVKKVLKGHRVPGVQPANIRILW
jgi:hypothetical protein